MDRLRELLSAVEQQERNGLAAANSAMTDTAQQSQELARIGSLIVAALFFAALLAVQRNLRIRKQLARTAQAGEARLGALLKAIPNEVYTIDAQRQVSSLPQGAQPGLEPVVIEPLLLDMLEHRDDTQPHWSLWCDPLGRRIFEVRLAPTGLGDHLATNVPAASS